MAGVTDSKRRTVAEMQAGLVKPKKAPPEGDRARAGDLPIAVGALAQAGMPAFLQCESLTVSAAGDPYEQEAENVAQAVVGRGSRAVAGSAGGAAPGGAPPPHRQTPHWQTAPRQTQRQTQTRQIPLYVLPSVASSRGLVPADGGQPLPPAVRRDYQAATGIEVGPVHVHTGSAAQGAAGALSAKAFTNRNHIWLGANQSPHDTRLMAHELTHVVQQGAPGAAATAGAPPAVQRDLLDDAADVAGAVVSAGESAVTTVGEAASSVVEAGADYFWSVVEEHAPRLATVLREISAKGILGYFGDLIRTSVRGVFDRLQADPGVIGVLTTTFLDLYGRAQVIVAALAGGDCGPLFAAVNQLKETVSQLAGEAWDAITAFFRPVGDFFSNLWQQFGAPLVDWLSAMAGDVWQWIQDLGTEIWNGTAPLRELGATAWTWLKEQIFGRDDAQGNSEGGLVAWITSLAGNAWDAIKTELAPVIAPIRELGESVMALLPLDAILNLRQTVQGWMANVQGMTQNMSQPQDVAANQATLRQILPGVLASVETLRGGLVGTGQWIAEKVGGIARTVTGFFAGLAGVPLLSPLAGALTWVQTTVGSLAGWAQSTVVGLFSSIGDGLVYLSRFIEPIVRMLEQLVAVIGDLVGVLPSFISGIWNRIPACIREPIQRFIVDNILSQIPVFAQILQIPDIWARISGTVMTILRQVFVDGNLAGAAWTFFQSLMSVLGLPPELVVNILSKAATAIGDILGDPVGFLLNLLSALKQGFLNFFGNIGTHLLAGVSGWLFSELEQANIRPPQDLSLRSIIGFVLDVLGITVDNFFVRLGERIGPERAQRIRRMLDVMTGALSWVVRLVNEGPGALWEELQGQLSNLWQMVLNGVIGWLNTTIIERATVRLLSMLDPTGIMAVVNSLVAIYSAIQSFVQYVRQILETVNTFLDGVGGVARGALEQAAGFLENGLVRILPIAIGFLANQVGLSGLGRRIGEMVETAREYVNRGIDWLINRAVTAFESLLGRGDQPGSPAGATVVRVFTMDDMQHTLTVTERAGQISFIMASSTPGALLTKLDEAYESEFQAGEAGGPSANRHRQAATALDGVRRVYHERVANIAADDPQRATKLGELATILADRLIMIGRRYELDDLVAAAGPQSGADVNDLARFMIQEQLQGDLSEGEVINRLDFILRQLRPRGLRVLALQSPTVDGRRTITISTERTTAAAIQRLIPAGQNEVPRGRRVVANITLTLHDEPDLPRGAVSQGTRLARDPVTGQLIPDPANPGAYLMEPAGLAQLPPTARRGENLTQSGGRLHPVQPTSTPGQTQRTITIWNTGDLDPAVASNASHAEPQFVQFLEQPDVRQWRNQIRSINMRINMSPCRFCTPDLVRIRGLLPQLESAIITFTEVYNSGPLATRESDLAALRGAHWQVNGPPAMVATQDERGRPKLRLERMSV